MFEKEKKGKSKLTRGLGDGLSFGDGFGLIWSLSVRKRGKKGKGRETKKGEKEEEGKR